MVGSLDAGFMLFAAAILPPGAPVPGGSEHHLLFQPLDDTVQAVGVPRGVPSMLTNGQDLSLVFSKEDLLRLAAVKGRVDPENLFRSNRPLPAGLGHDGTAPGQTMPPSGASDARD